MNNQLRIGNHVKYDNEIYQIESLSVHFPYLKTYKYAAGMVQWNKIKGIELTKQILIDSGFNEDSYGHYWISLQTHYIELIPSRDVYYPIIVQIPELSSDSEQRVTFKMIKYVNQLENLYFALTGEELELNFKSETNEPT